MGTVSVIIVSWNARAYLRDCLVSIRNAGAPTVCEVIVVDNASTDGSAEMVEADFAEVNLIRCDRNLGFATANNLGLEKASGSFYALINSDVIVHAGCIQQLLAHLEADDQLGLVGPIVVGADGRLQRTWRELPRLSNLLCRMLALDSATSRLRECSNVTAIIPMRSQDVEVINGCFWLARREAVAEVGGLDERFFFYAEDLDWCKRFNDRGWKIQIVPAATATHFGGASSARAPLRYSIEMLRANVAYWQKHAGTAGKCAFVVLSILHHALRLFPHWIGAAMRYHSKRDFDHRFERDKVCLRWLVTRQKKISGAEIG